MLMKQKNWFSVDSLSFSFSSNKLILPRTFIRLWWFDQITSFSFLAKFFITTAALASPSCNSFSMSGQKLTKLSIYKQNCAAYDVVFASKHLFMYLPFFFCLIVAGPYITGSGKTWCRPLFLMYFSGAFHIANTT